jgi:hypothetical protein
MQNLPKNLQIHILKQKMGENSDLIDLNSEVDSTLRFKENMAQIKEKVGLLQNKQFDDVDDDVIKQYYSDLEKTNNIISKQLNKEYGFKRIFKDSHIVGLSGVKNSGKSNNLVYMIKEFREVDKDTPIYIYGFNQEVTYYLKQYGVEEISEIRHLINKKDCIFICDEFQKLKLNDRRYTEERDEFKNYVYHNNVFCILSSPDIREFNSIIGGIIEKWLLKSVNINDCVNGSQLKKVIESYKGKYKLLGQISMPKDEILLINEDFEQTITCKYIPEADNKKNNKSLFK